MNRPKLLPTIAAFALAGLTFALGQWQAGRAAHKEALHAQIQAAEHQVPIEIGTPIVDPTEIDQRRVAVTGVYAPEATIYLDNRLYHGAPGFYVLTALKVEGGPAVVVNRGWMPVNPQGRETIVPPPTPSGKVRVEGIAMPQVSSFVALRGAATGKLGGIWPNFSFDAFATQSNLSLQPIVVQQTSAAEDGLVRDWTSEGSGSERNIAYAVQWYAFSALSIGLWFWFGVLGRGKRQGSTSDAGQPER